MLRIKIFLVAFIAVIWPSLGTAQSPVLTDVTGDGTVKIAAFGDSITFGVGDGTEPGEVVEEIPRTDGTRGYPSRVELGLQVLVDNEGVPGEELARDGIFRLPGTISRTRADIVTFFEGANDIRSGIDPAEYARLVQKSINVIRALGRTPVLLTLPLPCCDQDFFRGRTSSYSAEILQLGALNNVLVADVDRAFRNSCEGEDCNLYNLPEGLHPNTKGYDVVSQTVMATLLGIDVFTPDGAAELAAALGIPADAVVVKPDPIAAAA